MNWLTVLGILANAGFVFSGVPASIRALRIGSTSVPLSSSILITTSCLLMPTYLTILYGWNWLIVGSYAVETISWALLIWYRAKPSFETDKAIFSISNEALVSHKRVSR